MTEGTYHTIEAGESTDMLAYERGLFVDTIWNEPENVSLRAARKNPNALARGDRIFLPSRRTVSRDVHTGRKHVFRRKGVPSLLRIRIFNAGQPWSDTGWTLLADGDEMNGFTDSHGIMQCRLLPTAHSATLTVGEGDGEQIFDLTFGVLDPEDSITGVQRRLANLGYYGGETSGEINSGTRLALLLFQRQYELTESGEADNATVAKLYEVHG